MCPRSKNRIPEVLERLPKVKQVIKEAAEPGLLAAFVFIAGPTIYLLNLFPASLVEFFTDLGLMLLRTPPQGEDAAGFMAGWTTFYWAWWVSWPPFVGLFIAKRSRGRTLREFVTVIMVVPSAVCLVWFGVFGGTSIWMEQGGMGMSELGSGEEILFGLQSIMVVSALPFAFVVIGIMIAWATDLRTDPYML